MAVLLRLEYIALLCLSVFLFSLLPYAWWWYPLLLLLPDIGMLGYALSSRTGAWGYNLFHWLASAVIVYIAGSLADSSLAQLAGVVIIGHIGLDRLLGYGLKHEDSFKHTHLGMLR